MRAVRFLCLTIIALVPTLFAAPVFGIAVPQVDSPLDQKAFHHPALDVEPLLVAPAALTEGMDEALADLAALGVQPELAFLDARGGTWATLLPATPLLPGDGAGNTLTWRELGLDAPTTDAALGEIAWQELRDYLVAHRRELRLDPEELSHRVTVHDIGEVIQVYAARRLGELSVRGTHLTAVINHGNLVLLGVEKWAPTALATNPRVPASQATRALLAHLQPLRPAGFGAEPELLVLPAAGQPGPAGVTPYDYRLVWRLQPQFERNLGNWEGLVDAHSGELLAFRDTNHYGSSRRVLGGVYPISNDQIPPDGIEVAGYPMPFADVNDGSGVVFADSGGNVSGVSGTITTELEGQFVRMSDECGAINESSAGDIDLGISGGDDCTIPPGHSAGDTHSSRSGFYELNRVKELARGQLPANGWLQGQLLANMNINSICNAFWDGFSVNFFRSGGGCGNTGEIAGVFDHEWGHGMDDNDAVPSISNPGEGIADLYAALRLSTSCIGRGFFQGGVLCGGYGDPCTAASGCTGIRDIDWANHVSGQPHDVDWAQANCGGTPHCTGHLNSESAWDLFTRDLPSTYGFEPNRALEITTRVTFIGAGNVGTWFVTSGNCENTTGCGCGASSGYLQYLAADDDNGNTADGTPHMNALFDAFDRHQIHCTTPTVQDSGCAGRPTVAPVVSASPGVTTVTLSWDAVPDATRYKIYRTDGEFQCDFGKILVGEVPAAEGNLSFQDGGLQTGRDYSYIVAGFPTSNSCMGPASDCTTIQPGALFADGFESGDTTAWDEIKFAN